MQDEPIKSPSSDADATLPVTSAPAKSPTANRPPAYPAQDGNIAEITANPPWASDLRQLYNAVVEEPLPDSFLALLSKLDSED